jgi:hypothetical protein
MAESKWLWLKRAVDVVAQRLAQAEPNRLSDPEIEIDAAQEEILDQAALGALGIHGISGDPDDYPQSDWTIIHPSYWNGGHRLDWKNLCTGSSKSVPSYILMSGPIVYIDWRVNGTIFEIGHARVGGFHSLKVRAEDIDSIWPPPVIMGNNRDRQTSSTSPNAISETKNKGGRPAKYRNILFLELIRINTPDGLPLTPDKLLDRPRLKRQLQEFGVSYWGPDGEPSDSSIDTLLRELADWLAQKR